MHLKSVELIHFRGYRATTVTPADEAMTGVVGRNIYLKPTRPAKAGLRWMQETQNLSGPALRQIIRLRRSVVTCLRSIVR